MRKYVLYGAAAIGNLVKEALDKCQQETIGYIDKRAFEVEKYNGLPVYSIEQLPDICFETDTVVYIAVKNVFEHEKIAKMLYEKGVSNIIYKPYNVLIGNETKEELEMAQLYDDIFDAKITDSDYVIPRCLDGNLDCLHDYAIIAHDVETVTAYIPVEYIFTNDYPEGGMFKWGNVAIASFFTHINFFKSLSGDMNASIEPYLQEYCVYTAHLQKKIKVTDAWKTNVIANRVQIYEQMSEALDLDHNFFIRSAATAKWNYERGYFNLTSGKHRTTFLTARGAKYIPLKMSEEDYIQFLGQKKDAERLRRLLDKYTGNAIIPHPYFYRGIFNRDNGEHNFLLWISNYFGKNIYEKYGTVDFSKISLIDMTDDLGHFSRYLNRAGAKVERRVKASELEMELNRFFQENLKYAQGTEFSGDYLLVDEHYIDDILNCYKEQLIVKNIILKFLDESVAQNICKKYGYTIIKVIDSRYKGLKAQKSYLLGLEEV